MFRKKIKKGFTLIEILIAASLFVVVTTMTTMILFDIINTEKRTNILSAVYDDARVVMEQIATMIHENAIDYDEYYSVNVIQKANDEIAYGMYHGVYSGRFYDPGLTYDGAGVGSQGDNPENLGVECSDITPPLSISECKIIYKSSKDKNTGKNPYEGSGDEEDTGNAFCDGNVAAPAGGSGCGNYETSEDHNGASAVHDELFLLSPDGTKKTIIAKIDTVNGGTDFSIGILELIGMDSDQNGMVDLFTCATDYSCDSAQANIALYLVTPLILNPFPADIPAGLSISTRSDKSAFIPITPFRSTVSSLKFIISPVEDPYKAYAEAEMQTHPAVTILLTMEPSADEKARYPGQNPPPIYIQRTVTAGVHGKVESYPPTNELGWMSALIQSL